MQARSASALPPRDSERWRGDTDVNVIFASLDPTKDPNNQGRKLDFLNGKTDDAIYNPHALQQPVSPYEVLAGSIISASLISGLNSDLPGLVIAQVTENVFDSVSGRILLDSAGVKADRKL